MWGIQINAAAGRAGFSSPGVSGGLGLSASAAGLVLSIALLSKLVWTPLSTSISDRRTGLHRRSGVLAVSLLPVVISITILPFLSRASGIGLPLLVILMTLLLIVINGGTASSYMMSVLMRWDATEASSRSESQAIVLVMTSVGCFVIIDVSASLSDIWQPLPFLLVCLLLPASFLILRKNYQEPASPNVAGGKARITPLSTLGKNELAALGLRIFGTTCIYTANALIQMYFTSYAFNRLGLDSRQASYLYSLNFVVMVAVAIPASRLSRRLGLLTIIMGGALLAAATHLVLFLLPGLPSFFLVIIAGGAGMTAVLSQTSPFIANSVPDPQFLGRYISLEGFFGAIGVSIAPAIAGLVIDATGDFGYVWMLTASLLAAAALALSFDSKFRRNLEKL